MTGLKETFMRFTKLALALGLSGLLATTTAEAQRTVKPVLHGRHWVAITGKPLAATAGARMFHKGGNAVDSAAAMLAATSTMWDVLSWGGETQALIYNPKTGKVIGINAMGVAPAGATPEFYRSKNMRYPPEYGPLSATTPGTPGGLMVMLADYGTLSLAEVLAPAIEMANGYPIEARRLARLPATSKKSPSGRPAAPSSSPAARTRGRRPATSSASPTSPRPCASWSRPRRRR
jgi:gamma-glutamyltranspeptidase/glutathione hydrolase